MQKSYGISIPEKEKIQTDIDSLRNHINRERDDDSEQEDDSETELTVNECMELKMKESIAKEEGIRNETQISVSREEKFSEEKKVTNWEELDQSFISVMLQCIYLLYVPIKVVFKRNRLHKLDN